MVFQLSDTTSLVEGLSESWRELLAERLEVTNGDGISFMEQDTITGLMETLADISNFCMLHFLKLAFYQGQIDSEPDTESEPTNTGFRLQL